MTFHAQVTPDAETAWDSPDSRFVAARLVGYGASIKANPSHGHGADAQHLGHLLHGEQTHS